MDEIGTKLREYLEKEILFDEPVAVDAETSLIGRLDSLGFLQLLAFIEDEFEVDVPEQELVPENFATLAAVRRLVRARLEQEDPAPAR